MSNRKLALLLSFIGVGITSYLSVVYAFGQAPICIGNSGGCATVEASVYARLFGIPIAWLGLLGYLSIGWAVWIDRSWSAGLSFGLSLVGAGFSLYLTYLEIYVIEAICQWCIASAIIMILLGMCCFSWWLKS